jgi:predicted GNAT family N-acyltransferase
MALHLRWIDHLSPAYAMAVALRRGILRKPLGLEFTEAQLASESNSLHLTAWEEDVLLGTLLLTPLEGGSIQMRQVAVDDSKQRLGIGRLLVAESEAEAVRRGFTRLMLHARDTAVPFYEKLGYKPVGDEFIEVGIRHQEMEKLL